MPRHIFKLQMREKVFEVCFEGGRRFSVTNVLGSSKCAKHMPLLVHEYTYVRTCTTEVFVTVSKKNGIIDPPHE